LEIVFPCILEAVVVPTDKPIALNVKPEFVPIRVPLLSGAEPPILLPDIVTLFVEVLPIDIMYVHCEN
jgi:hypothetical protein